MDGSIRLLERQDLQALLDLYTDLHDHDEDCPPERTREVWAECLERPGLGCWGLFADGVLAASCVMVTVPNLTRGCRPWAVIENVVTRRDLRGRGLGKALLAHVKAEAWRQGCYKVMLQTSRNDEGVHAFYRSAGFESGTKTAYVAKPG